MCAIISRVSDKIKRQYLLIKQEVGPASPTSCLLIATKSELQLSFMLMKLVLFICRRIRIMSGPVGIRICITCLRRVSIC